MDDNPGGCRAISECFLSLALSLLHASIAFVVGKLTNISLARIFVPIVVVVAVVVCGLRLVDCCLNNATLKCQLAALALSMPHQLPMHMNFKCAHFLLTFERFQLSKLKSRIYKTRIPLPIVAIPCAQLEIG